MPYGFSFDLSSISKAFFRELARVAQRRKLHRRLGVGARSLAEKFRLSEITGLNVSDTLLLVEDLIDIHMQNIAERERFTVTKKRALFLPHCSRKYMDSRCQATFDSSLPSYQCAHCSNDCLVNRATALGEEKGYDVYVLPGGSCVQGLLEKKQYEGVVGVACSQELQMGGHCLNNLGLAGQAVPLIKNGCANTSFNFRSLKKVL